MRLPSRIALVVLAVVLASLVDAGKTLRTGDLSVSTAAAKRHHHRKHHRKHHRARHRHKKKAPATEM